MKSLNKFLNKASKVFTVLFAVVAFGQGYPEVTFHYGFIPFDRSCSKYTDFKIEEAWIEELHLKMDTLQGLWNSQGTKLLQTVVDEVGKDFEKRELHATMTLCKIGSMSHPFLINMRNYLSTATKNNSRPYYEFVGTVFHEILHIYIYDLLDDKKHVPLLDKYQEEPNSVQNHLHLMALFKEAYIQLGLERELHVMTNRYQESGGIYGRAWEIVDRIENHKDFIQELK